MEPSNGELQAEFERLLIAELERRRIPFHHVETNDIGVNLDVYIYKTESVLPFGYHMRYLGWGYLRKRILDRMTLPEYVVQYADEYLVTLRSQIAHEIMEKTRELASDNLFEDHRARSKERLEMANVIQNALAQVED